jgi:hypothetical protein
MLNFAVRVLALLSVAEQVTKAQHYSFLQHSNRPTVSEAARAYSGRVGVNRDFAPGRGEEIEETILRLD